MEPLKALTLLGVAGVISLVGAGAAGFYAGYTAGRGDNEPVVVSGGPGGTVSLKPVLEDIRALSKQVEALGATAAAGAHSEPLAKPVLDEIKALSRQIDTLKGRTQDAVSDRQPAAATADYSDELSGIRDQIKALNVKLDKQAEPKAPKALVDEIRSLSASVQTQEPNTRRAIAEEIRSAVATLQNAEPRVPKALLDELRNISANTRSQDSRAQPSVVDQIKILTAAIESLKARLPDEDGDARRPATQSQASGVGGEVAQLKQLIAMASDQFGKCQTQLASLTAAGFAQPQQAAAGNAVTVSQGNRQEPSAVVFYDNVMLRKDQEKQYDEIGVRLSLQSIGPRQVRLAVNRQGFGLSFGERKVFRSQDVECELNLMETNLNDSQARVSISCKR
jgi:hypothetical protein